MPDAPTPADRERQEVAAMVQRVRDFLGDAPDGLPFSRTVRDPTPWGTMEAREEETALTTADLRAMCDVVELLNESRHAVRAAYRAELRERVEGLEGITVPHSVLMGLPSGERVLRSEVLALLDTEGGT